MATPILFDFKDQASAGKSLKRVAQYMLRAGQPVISTEFDQRVRRSSGVSYREALLTLASGQKVTMRVTQTGDVFQVLLNGSVRPIKNAKDQVRAIGEIAEMAKANQPAFQRRQARVKVELPKGIKTAAPRMEAVLASRIAELDGQIAERTQQVAELQAELTETVLDTADDWPRLEADGNRYARDQYDLVPLDEHGEMPVSLVLREGAMPVQAVLDNAEEDPDKQAVASAVTLAESIASGTVLDSAGMEAAKATLQNALEIVETNSVINMGQGNLEQAALERANAESFRAALAVLDNADDPNEPEIPEPDEPVPSRAGDPAIEAAAKFQFEDEDGNRQEPVT